MASSWHFAETLAKINKAIKNYFVSRHEFMEIWNKIAIWLDRDPFPQSFTIFSSFFTLCIAGSSFPYDYNDTILICNYKLQLNFQISCPKIMAGYFFKFQPQGICNL